MPATHALSATSKETPMLDRRGFLKFIGGAAVGTLATPVVWKGLDDISIWSQNWPWIPSLQYGNHENTYVRTVSKLCPAAGATKIRLVGGRPVRVLSDPESPLAAASPRWPSPKSRCATARPASNGPCSATRTAATGKSPGKRLKSCCSKNSPRQETDRARQRGLHFRRRKRHHE